MILLCICAASIAWYGSHWHREPHKLMLVINSIRINCEAWRPGPGLTYQELFDEPSVSDYHQNSHLVKLSQGSSAYFDTRNDKWGNVMRFCWITIENGMEIARSRMNGSRGMALFVARRPSHRLIVNSFDPATLAQLSYLAYSILNCIRRTVSLKRPEKEIPLVRFLYQ